MIGVLPTSLVIQGKEYKIRTDYRVVLTILSAYNDCELNNFDKFLLDSLHEVLYDDDKHVVKIKSEKRYDFEPRTELTARITKIKL